MKVPLTRTLKSKINLAQVCTVVLFEIWLFYIFLSSDFFSTTPWLPSSEINRNTHQILASLPSTLLIERAGIWLDRYWQSRHVRPSRNSLCYWNHRWCWCLFKQCPLGRGSPFWDLHQIMLRPPVLCLGSFVAAWQLEQACSWLCIWVLWTCLAAGDEAFDEVCECGAYCGRTGRWCVPAQRQQVWSILKALVIYETYIDM